MPSDEKHQLYQKYWAHHLWVYRQVLVWTTRVLTLQDDKNVFYLLIFYGVANFIVMSLMRMGQSPVFLIGLFFLALAATHIFCVHSNTSNRIRILSKWEESEENVFMKICGRVAQGHIGILRMINTLQKLRNEDSKRFYCTGILLALLFSNIGYLISDFVLILVLVNAVLMVPFVLHYRLHLHVADQNWTELQKTMSNVLMEGISDIQKFIARPSKKQHTN